MTRRARLRTMIAATLLAALPARADPVADFYRGKEVRVVIGLPAGGGYDIYGRLFARHLSRFIPGNPVVVAQNMPGAAAIPMTNSMAAQQPRDGTVIGVGVGSNATAALFSAPGARYDARLLTWIGSMNSEVGLVLAYKTAKVKTTADLFTTELVVGGSGATDGNVMFPAVMNKVLGTKFRIIPGYGSTNTVALAMERGEIDGMGSWHYSSISTNKPEWLRDGSINFLVQLALAKHPAMPAEIPLVVDLAKTPEQRAILELVFAQQDMARPIFAPPGLPPERAKALRDAFAAWSRDPAVLGEAEQMKLEINRPMGGEDMKILIDRLHAMPGDIVTKAADAIQVGG